MNGAYHIDYTTQPTLNHWTTQKIAYHVKERLDLSKSITAYILQLGKERENEPFGLKYNKSIIYAEIELLISSSVHFSTMPFHPFRFFLKKM